MYARDHPAFYKKLGKANSNTVKSKRQGTMSIAGNKKIRSVTEIKNYIGVQQTGPQPDSS